jgi:hypothetical protein
VFARSLRDTLRQPKSVGLAVGLGYFIVWCLANAPGLRQGWWFLDDYAVSGVLDRLIIKHHLAQGRPGQLLWMTTFWLDAGGQTRWNVALRMVQGMIHATAAALAALLLWRQTGRPATLLAGVPFLTWPFATDVVLWRAAGQYPVAALISLSGVWVLAGGRLVTGALLIVAALLTHQVAACAGLVVWCVVACLRLAKGQGAPARREATALAASYAAGAGLSLWVAATQRMTGTTMQAIADPTARVGFGWTRSGARHSLRGPASSRFLPH